VWKLKAADGDDPVARKRPGRVKYSNNTLKRGYVSSGGDVYVWKLKKEEGGRHTPFQNKSTTTDIEMFRKILDRGEAGDNVGLLLRTKHDTAKNAIGNIRARTGGGCTCPGGVCALTAGLIVPVAMDKGLRFAIREGGPTVGTGQVTEIIK
jgi:elongation factor Tu